MNVVLFNNDFKILSDAFAANNNPLNEFGDLVSRSRNILLNKNDILVSMFKNKQTSIANILTHLSLHILHDAPSTLYLLILNELN